MGLRMTSGLGSAGRDTRRRQRTGTVSYLRWALGAMLIGLMAPVAAAQDGEVFQDWHVRCGQEQQEQWSGGCLMVQSVVNSQNQQPVMRFFVGHLTDSKEAAAVLILPLGVRVAPGVLLQIDQNEANRIPFDICLPDGCRVSFKLNDTQLSALKGGIGGRVAFQDGTGQNVELPFSLKGFTAALTAIQ